MGFTLVGALIMVWLYPSESTTGQHTTVIPVPIIIQPKPPPPIIVRPPAVKVR
ncbi:hypothetical protein ACIA8O_39930 [Kitasatospora sp. NPDC051853]|uniref:hypothetical protein n=1 Tax=Kitasatospora sp. NPDC051853 TaxID=3364058 RepID=UPI00378829B9